MTTIGETQQAAEDHAAIVEWLRNPRSYPGNHGPVEYIETHISQVFLTERFVYKLKKPVRYDFLDFSTIEKREHACREELRLNRRLARDVYLGFWPITLDAQRQLHFGGPGRVLDWVLQMHRLPAERMLDTLIRAGQLADADIRQLAGHLARYYAQAEPLVLRADEYLTALKAHVQGNCDYLLTAAECLDLIQVQRVHAAQQRLLRGSVEQFASRVLDGRMIDGHGDLRPEHICLVDPPVVFDCIEFSADLRRIDVLDELCFLAMECDALEAPAVGTAILDAYRLQSNDRAPIMLSAFYQAYRACVRGKVAVMRSRQLSGDACVAQRELAQRYMELADRYLQASTSRPALVITIGLMGTGKSTLSNALAHELGAKLLRTDVIRHEVLPNVQGAADTFGAGRYRPEARDIVYQAVLERANECLQLGIPVVVDGAYSQARPREALLQLAQQVGADALLVECRCPREVALQRIAERQQGHDASEARPDLYDRQAAEWELSPSGSPHCCVDTTAALAAQLEQVFRTLH